jgi:uncharacterized CHY-type Zn-finger protein
MCIKDLYFLLLLNIRLDKMNVKDEVVTCNVCQKKLHGYVYKDFMYCNYCFHINKTDNILNEVKNDYILDNFKEYILNTVDYLDLNQYRKLNVLVVNDIDSKFIDKVYKKLSDKIGKYNVNTVSVTPHYNSSYFSYHKHYKFHLTDYITDIIKNEHGSFDIILLNDSLIHASNPRYLLEYCKRLSKVNTIILCANVHTSVFHSMDILNLTKYVRNIFNTNSLKLLCNNVDLNLISCSVLDNSSFVSILSFNEDNSCNEDILDILYNEITYNIYNKSTYKRIFNYWNDFVIYVTDILNKYKTIGYNNIFINYSRKDDLYFCFENDNCITKTDLNMFDKMDPDNTLIIITDFKNEDFIKQTIKNKGGKKWLVFYLHKMIAYNL